MNAIASDPLSFLEKFSSIKTFSQGDRLFNQGDRPNGCYVVVQGTVATHHFDSDVQTEANLQDYQAGEVVGSIGMIDHSVRNISASAQTNVITRYINNAQLQRMSLECLETYQQFIQLSANTVARKFRALHDAACSAAVACSSSPIVDATVEQANIAQVMFLDYPEDKVTEIIDDIADAVNRQAHELAQACVNESGIGVMEHKVQKILLGTLEIAASLKTKKTNQPLRLESPGVDTIAMPMGVVFGIIPLTNPVETIVFKVLSSIKSRNAIIISSHRKARNIGDQTVNIIRDILTLHGAPVDLVQTPSLPSNRKLTQAFMAHEKVNFILATGGPDMVKSAYRSGTPAIGVGKGNAPVWICEDADIEKVAKDIVTSKSFDNGIVCGSENNIIIDTPIAKQFIQAAIEEGAAYLSGDETELLIKKAFTNYSLDAQWIGQSAQKICDAIGVSRDYPIKLILAEVESGNLLSPLVREKLAPILSFIQVQNQEEALFHATTILKIEGRGHTAIIHSHNQGRIDTYANAVEVSRVLVNSPGTQGCIGACNGLQLSWTLGCGTMGGGSTSDNVTYKHLQNVKRVAYGS